MECSQQDADCERGQVVLNFHQKSDWYDRTAHHDEADGDQVREASFVEDLADDRRSEDHCNRVNREDEADPEAWDVLACEYLRQEEARQGVYTVRANDYGE